MRFYYFRTVAVPVPQPYAVPQPYPVPVSQPAVVGTSTHVGSFGGGVVSSGVPAIASGVGVGVSSIGGAGIGHGISSFGGVGLGHGGVYLGGHGVSLGHGYLGSKIIASHSVDPHYGYGYGKYYKHGYHW